MLHNTFKFVLQYTTHYIEGEDGTPLPFVFNDIMGLEDEDGVQTQDLVTAVQGFIKEGHKVRIRFYNHN